MKTSHTSNNFIHLFIIFITTMIFANTLIYGQSDSTKKSMKINTMFLLAEIQSQNGQIQSAIEIYSMIIDKNPNNKYSVRLAQQKLLAIFFQSDPFDTSSVEKILNAILCSSTELDDEIWNYLFHFSVRQVQSSKDSQKDVWDASLVKLKPGKHKLGRPLLKELDLLAGKLDQNKVISPEKFWGDISKLGLKSDSEWEVNKRIKASKLSEGLARFKINKSNDKLISEQLRKLMLSAQLLKKKGELSRSYAMYTEIIEKYPEQKEAVMLARRNLVEILLDMESADTGLAQKHLSALISESPKLDNEIWNYLFRFCVRQIESAKDSQKDVWTASLAKLKSGRHELGRPLLKELDLLAAKLNQNKVISPEKFWQDISKLGLKPDSEWEVNKRIRTSRLSMGLARFKIEKSNDKKISGRLRQLMLSAQLLKGKGELSQSCSIYTEIIEKYPEQKEAVILSRRNIVGILLDMESADIEHTQKKLSVLLSEAPELDDEIWNYLFRFSVRQVQSSKDSQKDVWTASLAKLKSGRHELSRPLLKELDLLAAKLNQNKVISPEKFWQDISKLGLKPDSEWEVNKRIRTSRLSMGLARFKIEKSNDKKISGRLRQLMLSAQLLKGKGELSQSCSIYTEIIEKYPEHKEAVKLARRNLVEVLLDMESANIGLATRHLSVLLSEAPGFSNELWNLKCRLLIKRVISAADPQKAVIWKKEICSLGASSIVFEEKIFAELDNLILKSETNSNLFPMRIITDLLLLIPDTYSIQQLNQRRISIFAQKANWPEAIAAAKVDMVLSLATSEGPADSISRCLKIMEAANVSDAWEKQFVTSLFDPTSEGMQNKGTGGTELSFGDHVLSFAAQKAIQSLPKNFTARQKMFVFLFAGSGRKSLSFAHEALHETPINPKYLSRIFNDMSIVLSANSGHLETSQNFLELLLHAYEKNNWKGLKMNTQDEPYLAFLVECEEHALGKKTSASQSSERNRAISYGAADEETKQKVLNHIRTRFDEKIIDWGKQAYFQGELSLAAEFWAQAIGRKKTPDLALNSIETIYRIAKESSGLEAPMAVFRVILAHMGTPFQQKQVSAKIAALFYEQGNYHECISILDKADSIDPQADLKDMPTGFMRILSLIRLRKFDDALAFLKKMENWTGTPTQHGRAAFLEGWIFLQQNQKAQALLAFRRVIDKYGNTPFANKAKQLVQRLEGI